MESPLDRFNRLHQFYQRMYTYAKRDPHEHATWLIDSRRSKQKHEESRLDLATMDIRVSHEKLDRLGKLSVFAAWKVEDGFQIQVLLDLHEPPVADLGALSSAKVGRTIEQSLDRNYESLLRMVDGKREPRDERIDRMRLR